MHSTTCEVNGTGALSEHVMVDFFVGDCGSSDELKSPHAIWGYPDDQARDGRRQPHGRLRAALRARGTGAACRKGLVTW